MRVLLATVLLLGCDAGSAPAKPPPPPPAPAPIPSLPVPDAAPAEPPMPHIIDWELGGLGSWHGNVVGGIMWHVVIDLEKATIVITDPGGETKRRQLSETVVRAYGRLAEAVRAEPHAQPRHSCTDRLEKLRVDTLELGDSCPLSDRGAAALTAAIQRELPP